MLNLSIGLHDYNHYMLISDNDQVVLVEKRVIPIKTIDGIKKTEGDD